MVVSSVDTYDDFKNEILDSDRDYILVDFYAQWCGPCKRFAPTLDELSEKFGENIKFIKVDIDEVEECAEEYEIEKLPTFLIFDKGELVSSYNRIIGVDKTALENRLSELCNKTTVDEDF